MAILNPLVMPTIGKPQSAVAPSRRRRRNLANPDFYQEQEQLARDPLITRETRADQPEFDQQPMTGDYIFQQLAKLQQRAAPPKLDPAAKVRIPNAAEVASPGSFQDYYEQLGLVKQIGDEMLGAAQARSAYQKMQSLQNVMGQSVPGFQGPGGLPQGVGQAPANTNEVQSIVKGMAAQMGWTGAEWDALYNLIQRESGWNPWAANPTSAARGLFQKMVNMHGPLESTVQGQAAWGLNYIKQRYGSPTRALSHWLARVPINGQDVGNWY